MSGNSTKFVSSMMEVDYVPTVAGEPHPEPPQLEVSKVDYDDLSDAQAEALAKTFGVPYVPSFRPHEPREDTEESTSQFINQAPTGLQPTRISLSDSDLSSVDLNNNGDEQWIDVDTTEAPIVGKEAKEAGWESVDLSATVAKFNLTGEDEYSIETFRSSKKKEDLLTKLDEEIERTKVELKYAEMAAEHKKVADLKERLDMWISAKEELEARMEE